MATTDWNGIGPSPGPTQDNVRRADPLHPLDILRGRDFAGRFLISLAADAGVATLPALPRLSGVELRTERPNPDGARLVLTLLEPEQFELFSDLVDHLLRATADFARGDNAGGITLIIERVVDWQNMLRRRADLLTQAEQIGLAGELLCLRDLLLPRLSPTAAVTAWRGAHRDEQDFALGVWQIEVKTQLSTSDQRLQVSSEAQLDAGPHGLLVCHQTIAAAPAPLAGTFTLYSLAAELSALLTGREAAGLEPFETALEQLRYTPREEYDAVRWVLTGRRLFEVVADFPRLLPSMLPSGVQNVRYDILMSACERFAVDTDTAMDRAVS